MFAPPRYFQQQAEELKFGPWPRRAAVDWDGDGDTDLICGNTAGYVGFFENLERAAGRAPKWAAPRRLRSRRQA